ncbi:MAG: VWA domain-containing protein, partial [Crocinitomicaceae bacterium]
MKNNLLKYNIKGIIYKVLLYKALFIMLFSILYLIESSDPKNQSHLMFKNPQGIWFLLLLIPLHIVAFYKMIKHNKLVDDLGVFKPNSFFKPISQTEVLIKLLLIHNILVFIIIALLHPIKGNQRLKTVTETMELVVALDISNSMNVKDISKDASRLDIAKRALNQLMNSFSGEKFGLCVFAGGAYAQLPLTNDYPVAKVFINEVETGMLSNQGTNIAQAFDISLKMFSKESTSKAILMITDGENHEENPDKIIKQLKKNGIKVAVLGIGTIKGGLIPLDFKNSNLGYRLDENGNYLLSKLNPNFLKSLAKSTSGFASITSHPFPNLTQLIKTLKKMKIVKKDDFETTVEADYFTIFVIIALIMFIIYFLISGKKMERKFLLSILILFSFFQLNAQSWNDSIVEARILYKKGDYKKALKKYTSIKNKGPKSFFID